MIKPQKTNSDGILINKKSFKLLTTILIGSHMFMLWLGLKLNPEQGKVNAIDIKNAQCEVLTTVPRSERKLGFKRISKRMIEYIDQAKKSIYISAYGFTHPDIAQALANALRRGVKIHICIDKQYFQNLTKQLACLYYAKSDNIDIHGIDLPGNGIAHDKIMLIDDTIAWTGSYNLTLNADNNNRENAIVISSPAVTAKLKEHWLSGCNSRNAKLLKGNKSGTHKNWSAIEEPIASEQAELNAKTFKSTCVEAPKFIYCIFKAMPSDEMLSALLNAKTRGIEVKVMTTENLIHDIKLKVGSQILVQSHIAAKSNIVITGEDKIFSIKDGLVRELKSSRHLMNFRKNWD